MTLSVLQTKTAVGPSGFVSFAGAGGAEPYAYSVNAGGAGGSINPTTGDYTAPAALDTDPRKAYDTITVADYDGGEATATILVGSPLLLLCEIIQREMELADGRVYLWDQKITEPSDKDLFIVLSVVSEKPIANNNRPASTDDGMEEPQYTVSNALVDIDIQSRGPAARDRRMEVLQALTSVYSLQQQDANSFKVGGISTGFVNLSARDGAAIPYRYKISVRFQYLFEKTKAVDYFDSLEEPEVSTDPAHEID